ncbi:MAG: phosphoribosylanthranilate isomerase [Spirochaetaceae bacterium]|jgi:phosphoribosylanthranilate isomerase|nr:phosphoribosylanthranilate isomerase [Spirochaetaceae bacterium]
MKPNETPGQGQTRQARPQARPQMRTHLRIKICGLSRVEDIRCANEARPDYIGFVFAESRRRVTPEQARRLRERLDVGITPVGVFVDAGIAEIAALVNGGVIDMVQLHGNETAAYITRLRKACGANISDSINRINSIKIIKAVRISDGAQPPEHALVQKETYGADYLLLDSGAGSGKTFNWRFAEQIAAEGGFADSFFLAGGIHPGNIREAAAFHPFAIDVSSGAETDGVKDREKIMALVAACHG